MAECRIELPRDPAKIAEILQQIQSNRCADEVKYIGNHPIDGVHFVAVTTHEDKNLPVFEFDVKKYGAYLRVSLPKKFPYMAPVVSFDPYKTIPKHPAVDENSGRVDGFWTEEGGWKRETTIRDLCENVMAMLADVNTPEAAPPKQDQPAENQFRFIMTRSEFNYLCNTGAEFVAGLKSRYKCLIKFQCKKNCKDGPHLLITSSMKATRDSVAGALDTYLVQAGVRPWRKLEEVDPQPDAKAFVSFFEPPSSEAVQEDDLINFNDDDNKSILEGNHNEHCADVETARHNQTRDNVDLLSVGDGDGDEIFAFGWDQNGIGQEYMTGDAETMEKEEMAQSMEEMKSLFQEPIMNGCFATLSTVIAIDRVSSNVQKTGASLGDMKAVMDSFRDKIAHQRHQLDEAENELDQLERLLYRFKCQVCMVRDVSIRLDCGHGMCRECGGENECMCCRKKINSKLSLFY